MQHQFRGDIRVESNVRDGPLHTRKPCFSFSGTNLNVFMHDSQICMPHPFKLVLRTTKESRQELKLGRTDVVDAEPLQMKCMNDCAIRIGFDDVVEPFDEPFEPVFAADHLINR